MKKFAQLSLVSILGLVALSSAANATHGEGKGKNHHQDSMTQEKTKKVEDKKPQ